jgi:hypothetical protein
MTAIIMTLVYIAVVILVPTVLILLCAPLPSKPRPRGNLSLIRV